MSIEHEVAGALSRAWDAAPDDDGRGVWDRMPGCVVFLDIDGVLNSATWHREQPRSAGPRAHFDPAAVARLNRLTDRTGAGIVVSSSWRQFGARYVCDTLRSVGVTAPLVGMTPILDDGLRIMRPLPRGHEIQAWLDAAVPVPVFVILDDEPDMGFLHRRLVLTRHEVGLTDTDVDRAIALLLPLSPEARDDDGEDAGR